MVDYCAKCKKPRESFPEWKSKETYSGLDIHHNPPEFISNYLNESWSGETIFLCRECHKELHKRILIIMFKHSTLFNLKNSEYWTWQNIIPSNRKSMIEEIIKFTREWVNEN